MRNVSLTQENLSVKFVSLAVYILNFTKKWYGCFEK